MLHMILGKAFIYKCPPICIKGKNVMNEDTDVSLGKVGIHNLMCASPIQYVFTER